MDLAGSLVDDRRAGVAQKTLGRIFRGVAVRAMYLDRVVGGIEGGIGGVLLRDRDVARVPRARVLHPADLEVQEPADLVVPRHAGDHLLNQLVATDLLAERLAFARVFHGSVEACAHGSGRAGRDRVPPIVETAHSDLESVALVT